ncbi:MAG: hypothetical protein Q8N63_07635 [Nanoarchaeota archaeon]|nr:hypothetical protein [Nanoarchaeota archaeon]
MGRLENGVYTAKADSECSEEELRARMSLRSDLRTRMAKILQRSDAEQYNAMKDIMDLRNRTRIDPETGRAYTS